MHIFRFSWGFPAMPQNGQSRDASAAIETKRHLSGDLYRRGAWNIPARACFIQFDGLPFALK
jgi:hypothetical protein